jgi:hypothetical protein
MIIQAIMADIIRSVALSENSLYRDWKIGITHDVDDRYREWGRPERFRHWKANSLNEAQTVETYFVRQKGMKGIHGGDLDPLRDAFVYIF